MDTNLLQLLVNGIAKKQATGISNDTLIIILVAIAPTLASLGAYLKAKSAVAGVKEVHLAINSRLDKWLQIERQQGIASGRQEERESNKPNNG